MATEEIKKKIMFSKGDDYYFLTYNLLLILQSLNCFNNQYFRDYRKLSFMTNLISNPYLPEVLEVYKKSNKSLNVYDKELLTKSYFDGLLITKEIFRLLEILRDRELITLSETNSILYISIKERKKVKNFLNNDIFQIEKHNIILLQSSIGRISFLSYDTFLERVYKNIGINLWHA